MGAFTSTPWVSTRRPARAKARRIAPRPRSTRRAGSPKLFFRWDQEVVRLFKSTRRARRKKLWAEVLPVLNQALRRQPENRDIRYYRSWMRALTGNAAGALADLEGARFQIVGRDFSGIEANPA